jgi:hypothetical protein
MKQHSFLKRAFTLAVLLLTLAVPALAQIQTGGILGTVVGADDQPIPGVTVTLSGVGAPQVQATDAQGQFRFPGLPPGTYTLRAELDTFAPVTQPGIEVNVGRNASYELKLVRPELIDTLTVLAEAPAPLLNTRRIGQETVITLEEIDKIPTARDPWAVMQTVPFVLVDRVNVGGNESGQQAQYVGPGSGGDQAVWSLDGMVVTDMSAAGSSPGYYDFDSFEEMQITTGGSDASVATGGVILNMVTKRGTNEWRGSARYIRATDDTQSDLEFDEADLGQAGPWNGENAQEAFKQGNRIVETVDWGAELGGPIVRDRMWIWGSYAKPEIDLLTIQDFSDKTTLEDWNVKLNAQITPSNSATAFAWQSDKIKIGRDASPSRPQETTLNQSGYGDNPTAYKLEDTHIFGSSFYVTGMYSVVNGGFQLRPQGGEALPAVDSDGIWSNSFREVLINRPQEQYKADASNFFNTGGLSHELKYGAGYRTAEQSSQSRWPGGGIDIEFPPGFLPDGISVLALSREGNPQIKTEYTNLYLQDTVSVGNLTANIGVRYDLQQGENLATSVRANPVFPELLPAVSYAGGDAGFEWETITPRLGLTYALGEQRKTLLRGSYSRFADQLGTAFGGWLNPLAGQTYRYFLTDNGGGPTLEPGELGPEAFSPSSNLNPFTLQPLQSNAVDPDLNAPITDELLFGVEHALLPEFVIGLNLNWRRSTDLLEAERLVFDAEDAFAEENLGSVGRAHRPDDYVLGDADPEDDNPNTPATGIAPDGSTYSVPFWELRPGVSTRNGFLLENGDREQEFRGASLVFNKRLANRWMLRGNVSWQDWTWDIPDSENEDPTGTVIGGIEDGTEVLQGSGTVSGAKPNVFINSTWSYSLNGMYQIAPDRPWGFNVAANLTGRQGYPIRYARQVFRNSISDGAGAGLFIPIDSSADAYRNPDIHVVDLRLEKEFNFSQFGLTLGADVFNALNESYVLQRQGNLEQNNSDHVVEILSPRLFRLGAKISFR